MSAHEPNSPEQWVPNRAESGGRELSGNKNSGHDFSDEDLSGDAPHSRGLEEGKEFRPDFSKRGGLLPCIVQDAKRKDVLMLGYVNRDALDKTLASGLATFYSTSRQKLWTKGEESGNILKIVEIRTDCDQDALIYLVEPVGDGVCHTRDPQSGKHRYSCFYRRLQSDGSRDGQHISGEAAAAGTREDDPADSRKDDPADSRKDDPADLRKDDPAVGLQFIYRSSR